MKTFILLFLFLLPFAANADIASVEWVDSVIKTKADDNKVVHLSGDALGNRATIKLTADDNISTTINGNGITVDIGQAAGDIDAALFSVKDGVGNEVTMVGVSADDTNGLKYTYMGGTATNPAMKMTNDGDFTFREMVVVGAPTDNNTTSNQADTVGERNKKINSITSKVHDANNNLFDMWIE